MNNQNIDKFIVRFFQFNEHQTSIKQETIAGITTFLTMAYVIMVNPAVLSITGMQTSAVFVATCLAAAFGTILMGIFANYPIALAPSMGLNAYFAYVVVGKLGYPWPIALSAVFIAGILFILLTFFGIRQKIIYLIPDSLKTGVTAGIGLFLGVIGLKNIHVVSIIPHLQFHLTALWTPATGLCLLGLIFIMVLEKLRVSGAIILAIVMITILSIVLGMNIFHGIVAMPADISPVLLKIHFLWPLNINFLEVIFTFFFVALFDSTGTLIAILQQAHLISTDGTIKKLTPALFADSTATVVGSLLGTSTTGSFIESSAGVRAGGRTGFSAIIVGLLFLGALFLTPLTKTIPAYATAPALLYVAILMAKNLLIFKWKNFTDFLPALIIALGIPLTFSIATGISLGIICYVILQIVTKNFAKLNITLCVLAVILLAFLLVH